MESVSLDGGGSREGRVSGGFDVSTDVSLLVVTCRSRGFEIMMIVLRMGCLGDVMIR